MNKMNVFTLTNKIDYLKAYALFSASKTFIIGGAIGDDVYMVFINEEELFANFLDNIQSVATSGKNRKCNAYRIAFSKELKNYAKQNGEKIGTKKELEYIAENIINDNKGYAFEYMIYKYYNRASEWKKDNTKFYQKGDININGIEYQIKSHRGNLSNEITLAELLATA